MSRTWRANPDYRFLLFFGEQDTDVIVSNDTFPPGVFYFVAPMQTGSRPALLDVNDSDPGSPQTVNLSGTGK